MGERLPLVDHNGGVHGIVETTRVTITPLHLVGDDVAHDEGEGFADAADWRRDHVAYWTGLTDVLRSEAGDPGWQLREAEPVVVEWFRFLDSGGTPTVRAETPFRSTIGYRTAAVVFVCRPLRRWQTVGPPQNDAATDTPIGIDLDHG
ncbi:MAG: ASCH domain-containing protein [Nocardioidaceae bacterium]